MIKRINIDCNCYKKRADLLHFGNLFFTLVICTNLWQNPAWTLSGMDFPQRVLSACQESTVCAPGLSYLFSHS